MLDEGKNVTKHFLTLEAKACPSAYENIKACLVQRRKKTLRQYKKDHRAMEFCTSTQQDCPLHPENHDQGCTPCIMKNLKVREIPSCFFHQTDPSASRKNDSYEEFARIVLNSTDI